MQLKQLIIGGLLSIISLSALALISTQQAQINNLKPFLIIVTVTLILGVTAYHQKQLQHH